MLRGAHASLSDARPDDEPHPTAMIERPGRVLRWVYDRFFREIAFPPEVTEKVRAAAERGQVIYVCRTLSYIEYLYFTFAFLAHGLPLARFANGVKTLLMQPLGRLLRGVAVLWRGRKPGGHEAALARVVERGQSAMLFLKRPHTLFGWEPAGFRGAYVEELIRIQREREERGGPTAREPILFVPLILLWGSPALRAVRARRGIVDVVFGEREAPGRLRALWQFLRHFKDSQVVSGSPLDLRAFLVEEGELPTEILARRLRWQLGGRIEAETRVVLGPVRKSSRRIREEVLRSRRLVKESQEIGRAEKLAPATILKRARAALAEIAADPKPWMFEFLRPIFAWVWRKIFDGIEVDQAGLERVREAARKGPLLLVPSHKSHIDYLVLSWVFVENDLVPPHIAAGANLSFFPLGSLFRRAGAFFLRRSFRGDKLYAAVFRAYVRKLLREGHSVEFFIEGGRSRSGKLLQPKLGLLGMVVDAALDEDGRSARRTQVVPISIGYEKVIEERSYARELSGGEKKKEDVRGLIRATRVLFGAYGRLNIQFDEPFQLGRALWDAGAMAAWDEEGAVVPAGEPERRHATSRLAHRIIYGINRVTAVTPTALCASALLASGRRGTSRKRLLEDAAFLIARARAVSGRLAVSLADPALLPDAIDRAIDLLARDGDLEVRSGTGSVPGGRPLDEIYTVPDERRPRLAYYRNNALHLYAADALVALALLSATGTAAQAERQIARGLLRARTLELSRLLKLELSYRTGERFEAIFDSTVSGLIEARLLEPVEVLGEPGLRAALPERLELVSGLVHDLVEGYWVAARGLETLTQPTGERELVRRIHDLGERLLLTGEIARREACAQASFQNALTLFTERGVLLVEDRKLRLAPGAKPAALAAEIAALLSRG